jgi:hypothetical protein
MKKKIFLASLILLISSALFSIAAQAQNLQNTLSGLNETAGKVKAFNEQTSQDFGPDFLATKTGQIIGIVLSFIGVLFLGLMIYAGILWMTAAGNDQQITQSKTLLVNATIGIIIVFAAYAITAFLGNKFAQ